MIWLATLLQGILPGGLYALVAAGLSLAFGIMRLVNLAHRDLIVAAACLILFLVSVTGLHPIAAPLMFAAGWLLQRLVLARTLGEDILPPPLVTFGLSVVIQNALLEGFGADSRRLPPGELATASVAVGPVNLGALSLMSFASMRAAPRGFWRLISDRSGLHLFPIRRRLVPGTPLQKDG